ncbi:hypothetical protein MATL_G00115420 [Megalops atlanticus]|uniref:Exonuclease V n=1 Tax=Megalops atlanticus TaxID=7932 RepID=A0A9D3T7U1_MEGAT|nr:hypothetical protein MATL_G00115420 [Megalops atlanticus]
MNPSTAEPPGDWGDISDAELLNIESEHLDTALPHPDSHSALSEKIHDPGKQAEQRPARVYAVGSGGVGRSPQKRKRPGPGRSPMERFWRRHLSVTQVCGQTWCELQVDYGLELPHLMRREGERAQVKTGASIHLARELEVHDVVPVCCQSREDRQAITFLNFLSAMPTLQAGDQVKELPVFGVLEDVFLVGVIDELCYTEKGELALTELKTRKENCLPAPAQVKGHNLQVGLYKLLFDSLVRGELTREQVITHLRLRPHHALGAGVLERAEKLGLQVSTFGDLLDVLILNLNYCELPAIDLLRLEYCHQGSGSLIEYQDVPFSEPLLRAELRYYLSYWTGHREPRGVDIEEAWKCTYCSFKDHCEWKWEGLQGTVTTPNDKTLTDHTRQQDSLIGDHIHQQDPMSTVTTPTDETLT